MAHKITIRPENIKTHLIARMTNFMCVIFIFNSTRNDSLNNTKTATLFLFISSYTTMDYTKGKKGDPRRGTKQRPRLEEDAVVPVQWINISIPLFIFPLALPYYDVDGADEEGRCCLLKFTASFSAGWGHQLQ